jgi:hypothetical protein
VTKEPKAEEAVVAEEKAEEKQEEVEDADADMK